VGRNPLVLGIGELLWDVFPGGRHVGGAVANVMSFARLLGAEVLLGTRVGADGDGRALVEAVRRMGIGTALVQEDPLHPTGRVDVRVDEAGVPSYEIHENAAWDFIEAPPALLEGARGADALCFGTLCQRGEVSRRTVRRCVEQAERALRVYDVNLRQEYFTRDIVEWSCRAAHVVKLNHEEIHAVSSLFSLYGDEAGKAEMLVEMFDLRMLALTRGGEGSILFTPDGAYEHPGYPAEVSDTVGAGDAFTAVLTVGLLRGLDPDTVNDAANRVAAYVCSMPGATPEVPPELREVI